MKVGESLGLNEFGINYLRDQVLEVFRWSREEHEARNCPDWFTFYRHFKNYVDRGFKVDDNHSNMGVGLAHPTIEIMHARLMEPWSKGDELIKAIALQEPGVDRAPKVAGYLNHTIQNVCTRPLTQASLFKKSALIIGRGVWKYWVRHNRPGQRLTRSTVSIMPWLKPGGFRIGSVLGMRQVPRVQHFDFAYTDAFDFWGVPGVRMFEDWDWTFERGYLTDSQAWARIESGEWEEQDISGCSPQGYDQYRQRRLELEAQYQTGVVRSGQRMPRPHSWFEAQGRFEIKRSAADRPEYMDVIVQMLDEDRMVMAAPLGTWDARPSYIVYDLIQDPYSDRPIGVIEPIEDVLLHINDFANIGLDNARKIIESPLAIDPNSVESEEILLGPGEINWIRNPMYAVKAIEMKDLPPSFYQFLGWFNDLVQRISGVSDYFGGLNTSDTERVTKTATGMNLMAGLAASRFGPLMAGLDREAYRPLARAIFGTAKQRMTKPESLRLPGNPESPFTSVGPDDLDALLEFEFNTRSLDPSADQKREEFIGLATQLMGLKPELEAQGTATVDVYELARVLMDRFGSAGEAEKLLPRLQMGVDPVTGQQIPLLPNGQPLPMMPMGGPEAAPGQPAVPSRPSPTPKPPQGGPKGLPGRRAA